MPYLHQDPEDQCGTQEAPKCVKVTVKPSEAFTHFPANWETMSEAEKIQWVEQSDHGN